MTDRTKNTNPEISAKIAGIGYLSPRGEELKEVARWNLALSGNIFKATQRMNGYLFLMC